MNLIWNLSRKPHKRTNITPYAPGAGVCSKYDIFMEVLVPQLKGVVINTAVNQDGEGLMIGFAENHEFLPMIRERLTPGSGYRLRNVAWPAVLEIQPIPSGPNTWQVVNRSFPC